MLLLSVLLFLKFVGYNDDILDVRFLGKEDSHIVVATNSSQIKVFVLATNSCQILYGHTGQWQPAGGTSATYGYFQLSVSCNQDVCICVHDVLYLNAKLPS